MRFIVRFSINILRGKVFIIAKNKKKAIKKVLKIYKNANVKKVKKDKRKQ